MAKYLVQHRRGSAAQWAEENTIIPLEGEIVIEIDDTNSLHKLKIGDGVHTYDQLAYLMAGDEIITQVLSKTLPRVVTVELTTNWTQDTDGRYSQIIALDNITNCSRLDLQPDADMLAEFKQLNLIFTTENKNGSITVYSIGDMPLKSYTMQATIIETDAYCEKIIGTPIGVPSELVNLSLSAEENPDDKAPNAKSVATQLTMKAEGVNANYDFTSPGWKRVLNIIRATNGSLNLGIAKTTNGKVTQALGVDFTGYVKFPADDFRNTKPVIYQRYNNIFGLDPNEYPEKRAAITKVRVGYPTEEYGTNPVNCYVDIYVDFEPREGYEDYVAFNMSYSGKAASHNTSAIITETPAEDVGIYGEALQYYEFAVKVGPDIYTEGEIEANKFIGDVEAEKVVANEFYAIGENEEREFNVTDNFTNAKVIKDSIESALIDTMAAYKKYNYLYNTLKTGDTTKKGVTLTVHPSGAITINGTCTAKTTFNLFNGFTSNSPTIYLPAGSYKFKGLRFIMWETGITPDINDKTTYMIVNDGYSEIKEMEVNLDSPKILGHVSFCPNADSEWNDVSFVPYLYRAEDNLDISYSYDIDSDIISITGSDGDYGVDVTITERAELYGTSARGESVLELSNKRIVKNNSIINNSYNILIAETGTNDTFEIESYTKLGSNDIIVDSVLSATSTNPVQNKIITNALNNKLEYNDNDGEIHIDVPEAMASYFTLTSNDHSHVILNGMYGTLTLTDHTITLRSSDDPDTYFTLDISAAGNGDPIIEGSENVKQTFKDWLGIS